MATATSQPVPYSFGSGVRAAGPVMLGYVPIGFAFGVLARGAGFTVAEIGLMSLLVYAGSSQFIGTSLFAAGTAAPAIISTTFLVNLRHLLMSTALVPSLRENPPLTNSLLAYGITDETFAVNTALLQGRTAPASFTAGLHIAAQSSWVVASVVGALAGQMVGNTEALGLDFALPAMFVGLLMPNLRGEERRPRLAGALVAAAVAVAIIVLWPAGASWSIIIATMVAATVGVLWKC
ncbi:MAG TPA: AzlC family ABC transporter permease [Symbiobacteriaceae bacterium]|nr:AzlC family ABC transporter permease [Symbiobacteriaceae bacterium]